MTESLAPPGHLQDRCTSHCEHPKDSYDDALKLTTGGFLPQAGPFPLAWSPLEREQVPHLRSPYYGERCETASGTMARWNCKHRDDPPSSRLSSAHAIIGRELPRSAERATLLQR